MRRPLTIGFPAQNTTITAVENLLIVQARKLSGAIAEIVNHNNFFWQKEMITRGRRKEKRSGGGF